MLDFRDATAAWWTVQVIVAVYFTSGIVKLINTAGSGSADRPDFCSPCAVAPTLTA